MSDYLKFARNITCPRCGMVRVGALGIENHLITMHQVPWAEAHEMAGRLAVEAVPREEMTSNH